MLPETSAGTSRSARSAAAGVVTVAFALAAAFAATGATNAQTTARRAAAGDPASPQATSTTVFLVRHAEKAEPGDPGFAEAPPGDPPLTRAGHERARSLGHTLSTAGVTTIYTSEFERTRDTVRPLAERLGLPLGEHPAADVDGLAAAIRAEHRGGVVVVAGHSDTVPAIIAALGAGEVPPIDEATGYDNLFVVTIDAGGDAGVVTLKYGRPAARAGAP